MKQCFKGWMAVGQALEALAEAKGRPGWPLNDGQCASLRGIAARLPRNGVVIADEVGMGKTRIAVALTRSVTAAGGRVLGFDIQPEAIASTRQNLARKGLAAELHCDSHANLLQYVQPGTVDAVMFNFGWLPGADHGVFSHAQSSILALEAALEALRPGGVLSAILYSGKVIGSDEKTEILQWMRSRPLKQCTALVCGFANWADTAPLPCFLLKK